jgi:hypothetical protein
MVKRLIGGALGTHVLLLVLIYFFTKSIFYSIIFSLGAMISILGFLTMIKMTDLVLKKGKGPWLFILALLVKLAVIVLVLYLVSRASGKAVIFHVLGLSVIVIAIAVEGIYQVYLSRNKNLKRSISNGRA